MTRELGEGPLPEVIARFVAEEFEAARGAFEGVPAVASAAVREEADAVLRRVGAQAPRSYPPSNRGNKRGDAKGLKRPSSRSNIT